MFFSRSTPNLPTVIPAMDLIDEKLTLYSNNADYQPSIRAAVGLAKKTLDRYYQLTDHSEVYRIAMGKCSVAVQVVLLTIIQCFTPVINSRISRMWGGRTTGFKLPRHL